MENNVIEIKNLSVYQGSNLVLNNVNVSVKKGEFLYLIGKTGSGKSSLLKMLYAEIPVKSGSIAIAGSELKGIKEKDIPFVRRKLGIVFQDFQLLYDRTVNDNLIFVMQATGWKDKQEMKVRCEEVLSKVGLINKGVKMPHELSGGEQQRVAIARALAMQPKIMLFDEPTSALDVKTKNIVTNIIKELSNNRTLLIITHDNSNLKLVNRTIKIQDGKIIN
jgi:cell division transport system ATP-binding protein